MTTARREKLGDVWVYPDIIVDGKPLRNLIDSDPDKSKLIDADAWNLSKDGLVSKALSVKVDQDGVIRIWHGMSFHSGYYPWGRHSDGGGAFRTKAEACAAALSLIDAQIDALRARRNEYEAARR